MVGNGHACAWPRTQPFIYFLQYNMVAASLNVPWPSWWTKVTGAIQCMFSSIQGIYSVDCILAVHSSVPISVQRAIVTLVTPIVLFACAGLFWLLW